jgi:hypothetical protein
MADGPTARYMPVDRHVVWRVGKGDRCLIRTYQGGICDLIERAAAQDLVASEDPKIVGAIDRRA